MNFGVPGMYFRCIRDRKKPGFSRFFYPNPIYDGTLIILSLRPQFHGRPNFLHGGKTGLALARRPKGLIYIIMHGSRDGISWEKFKFWKSFRKYFWSENV